METFLSDTVVWIEAAGAWAYVLAPMLMMMVAILPIPAELPALMNGMIFGPWLGSLVTWGGALTGAMISFELSRRLGRPLAERFVPQARLAKADEIVLKGDWWGLLLPRFIPVIAFTALNWAAGLTPVTRWRFFWTTAVGILPGALIFTSSGAGLPILLERFPVATWVVAGLLLAYGVLHLYRGTRRNGLARAESAAEASADLG